MEINEFIDATSRIETYYGKEYTKEQAQIMFEELKELESNRYKKLISVVLRKCKYLPRLSDFFDAHNETPKITEEKEKKIIECKKCNGTGYVTYKKKINNGGKLLIYTMAAVCDCGNAQIYRGWEIEDKEHRTNYYTPTLQELGLSN